MATPIPNATLMRLQPMRVTQPRPTRRRNPQITARSISEFLIRTRAEPMSLERCLTAPNRRLTFDQVPAAV